MLWVALGLFAVIAAYKLFIYIRIFFRRIILYFKLKAAAKTLRFKVAPTRPLWLFARECGKRCDFYLETDYYVYSIKLMASHRKRNEYRFLSEDTVVKEYNYWMTGTWTLPFVLHTSRKVITLSKINFNYRYREKYGESIYPKKFMPMLLFCPVPLGISYIPDAFLSAGCERKSDYIPDMLKGLTKNGAANEEFDINKFMRNTGDGEILYNKYLVCGTSGLMRKIINERISP